VTDQVKDNDVKALLLAAGEGRRLRPLTETVPKCMVPIGGQPLLDYWFFQLFSQGIENVIINTCYLAEVVERHLQQSPWQERISVVREEELLGKETCLVAHADNLALLDLRGFLRAHSARPPGCAITMMVFQSDNPTQCGIVELDDDGVVQQFHEKVPDPPGTLANGAVYLFEPEIIDDISHSVPMATDLSTEVLPRYLGRMSVFRNDLYLRDIGTMASLDQARLDVASEPRFRRIFL